MQTNDQGRTQADLARAAKCSPSWITRTLRGEVHLTPDQACAISEFLRLSAEEADYFCLLVDSERATTPLLRKKLQQKLGALEERNRGFRHTIAFDSTLNDQDCMRYYSSWIYASLHVASMVAPFAEDILAGRFGVSPATIRKIMGQLQAMGLVVAQNGKWQATSRSLHLPADQMMATTGHVIWRNHVVDHLQKGNDRGLHYSAIHCLSRSDVAIIAEKLKNAVSDCRKIIDRSPGETLSVLCLDWYEHAGFEKEGSR